MFNSEQIKRLKILRNSIILLATVFVCVSWYATQNVAADLGYPFEFDDAILYRSEKLIVYKPLAYYFWSNNEELMALKLVWDTIKYYDKYIWISLLFCVIPIYFFAKHTTKRTSHGSADFASAKEIEAAGFCSEQNGFVCGVNPYTGNFLLHNGSEHILVAAPSGSGKGIGLVIPTATVWRESIFIFDPKAEIYEATSWYRKTHHGQKIIKFEPLNLNGSSARWNPFAEIDFQGIKEMDDASNIANIMTDTGESNADPFWKDSAAAVIKAVIVHLLYKHYNEGRTIPCPSDLISFISSPETDKMHLFANMKTYSHISAEDFLEEETEEIITKDTDEIKLEPGEKYRTIKRKRHNILKELWKDDCIRELTPYINAMNTLRSEYSQKAPKIAKDEKLDLAKLFEENSKKAEGEKQLMIDVVRDAILHLKYTYPDIYEEKVKNGFWRPPDITAANGQKEILKSLNEQTIKNPWYQLLVHPKVAEGAATIVNSESGGTSSSILSSAQTPLALYQNPLIKKNTAVSDFSIRDLKNPDQAASLYYVCASNDVEKISPLTRLFVSMLFQKLTAKMTFNSDKPERKLLLLLDEFPALQKLPAIENNLNICRGYGIRICLVVQTINQINKLYTKDNALIAGCPIQIFYKAADLDTAKTISETLGDKTITTTNNSTTGEILKCTSSTSEIARKLMTPDEVNRLPDDKEIVIVAGHRPILGNKLRYFAEPYFDDKVRNDKKKSVKLSWSERLYYLFTELTWQTEKKIPLVKLLRISDKGTKISNFKEMAALYQLDRKADQDEIEAIAKIKEKKESKNKKTETTETVDNEDTSAANTSPGEPETPVRDIFGDIPSQNAGQGKKIIRRGEKPRAESTSEIGKETVVNKISPGLQRDREEIAQKFFSQGKQEFITDEQKRNTNDDFLQFKQNAQNIASGGDDQNDDGI